MAFRGSPARLMECHPWAWMNTLLTMRHLVFLAACLLIVDAASAGPKLADQLRDFDATVVRADTPLGKSLPGMLAAALKARRDAANEVESKLWHLRLRNKTDWEEYRDTRLKRLRAAL